MGSHSALVKAVGHDGSVIITNSAGFMKSMTQKAAGDLHSATSPHTWMNTMSWERSRRRTEHRGWMIGDGIEVTITDNRALIMTSTVTVCHHHTHHTGQETRDQERVFRFRAFPYLF
jgi:hypothetical protein